MHDILDQIFGYIRGVWRFRWFIYLIAWPMCIAGWLYVHQMPDIYQSKARVFVDTSSALRPLLRGLAAGTSADEGLRMMTRTLMSRPNLEKVARMTDMDLTVNTPEEMDALITRLSRTIKFSGGQRGNKMYYISYKNKDPQLAKNTVQSLLTIFMESTLGDTRKDGSAARKFIDDQIEEYEMRLIEADNRVKEFKQQNVGMMPGSGKNYFARLKGAKSQLSGVELELEQAVNLRDELKRQVAGEEPVFGMMPSASQVVGGLSHPLDSRIFSLEAKLDDLLLKYTEKHPDVINAQSTIKRLQTRRDNDLAEIKKSLPRFKQSSGINQNPVYQQLKISLGQAEAKIASLFPRVRTYRANVKNLEMLVDTIHEIEAKLKNLNRDYNINKKNYEQLLSRRESARLSERAGSAADDVSFRIIEAPKAAFNPIGPNRRSLETGVLIGGLLAGLAFAIFISLIKPTYDTPRSLQLGVKMPVLGYISRVWTPQEKRRRQLNLLSFGLVGVVLLGLFGGMMLVETAGISIWPLF